MNQLHRVIIRRLDKLDKLTSLSYHFAENAKCLEAVTENSLKNGSFNRQKIPQNGNAVYTRLKANNSQKSLHQKNSTRTRQNRTRNLHAKFQIKNHFSARASRASRQFGTCLLNTKRQAGLIEFYPTPPHPSDRVERHYLVKYFALCGLT